MCRQKGWLFGGSVQKPAHAQLGWKGAYQQRPRTAPRHVLQASQKELGAAHNRVLEKRQLTNPLNAPLLKGVLGRQ